ncbi:glycosyl transferase [Maribacter sp. ANRC-HE7]|uniref:Glycosyl transferase n=1 Tax=Maribacter aquimaris TaxID=2737171 RepID=A0ABR7V7Z5_9FLAO|nr:glycosyltransferase family protein [Maribacter aquimaris]MBD0779268.1 glycosyl transferase [Maribacter aquimaris]
MKILYAIQGTGNGHLSRARDIIPELRKRKIALDILVSGTQADVKIPYPIKYQLKGLSFIFGKKGGVDMWRTYLKTNAAQLQKEIRNLPITDYDLIINDFEPVSAWACKLRDKPCVGFSHQAAVIAPNTPKPLKNDLLGKMILKKYAPTSHAYGLHFKAYGDHIFTPIIRKEIRNSTRTLGDYYTVYLPSYSDEKILKMLSKLKGVKWEVFSKHTLTGFLFKNITVRKINNEAFIRSMANCRGILCGAGFETPAEALYLGKKLLAIPMKGQYEQQCNAMALNEIGVPTMKSLKMKHLEVLGNWVETDHKTNIHYPDITANIVNQILQEASVGQMHY